MTRRKGYGLIALLALLLLSATGAFADGIVWAGNGLDNEGVASGNRLSAKAALDAGRRSVKRTAGRLPSPLSSSVAKLDEKIVITEDGAVTPSSFPLSFSVSYDRTPNLRFDPETAKGFSLVLSPPKKEGDDSWVTKVLVTVEGSPLTESYKGKIVATYPDDGKYAETAGRIPVNFDVTNKMTGGGGGGGSTPPSPDVPPVPEPTPEPGPQPGPGPSPAHEPGPAAPEDEGGGGGGGCDGFGALGGLGLLALAGAGAFVLRRRG